MLYRRVISVERFSGGYSLYRIAISMHRMHLVFHISTTAGIFEKVQQLLVRRLGFCVSAEAGNFDSSFTVTVKIINTNFWTLITLQ